MKIVQTKRYLKDLKCLGATAGDIDKLELDIARSLEAGDVIPGLEGVHKIRFSIGNKGKRSARRAIYFLMVSDELAIMLFDYAKSQKKDLTRDEKKAAAKLIREFRDG